MPETSERRSFHCPSGSHCKNIHFAIYLTFQTWETLWNIMWKTASPRTAVLSLSLFKKNQEETKVIVSARCEKQVDGHWHLTQFFYLLQEISKPLKRLLESGSIFCRAVSASLKEWNWNDRVTVETNFPLPTRCSFSNARLTSCSHNVD